MRANWNIKNLKDICIFLGRGVTPSYTEIGGIRVLNQKCIREQRINFGPSRRTDPAIRNVPDDKILQNNDILVNSTGEGTLGRVAQIKNVSELTTVDSHITIVRPNSNEVVPEFLGCVLRHLQPEIESMAEGSTGQTELSRTRLSSLEINIPTPLEQRNIASIIDAIDEKISINLRMCATLEQMSRALFQSWFMNFDPVHAKVNGNKPINLDKSASAIFPNSFDKFNGLQIPSGWKIGSIYEIADVIYGAPFSSSLFNSEKIGKPLIRIRDLQTESAAVFTNEVHPKGYLIQAGDIAVGMDGEFRSYLWGGMESWVNQRVCVFKPRAGWSAAFVRNSIIAPLADVEATETATTVIHLGKNDIDRFKVLIPDEPVAELFNQQCQSWYDQIVINKQQSRTLTSLRDTLLPKLLTGELSVESF